MVRMNGCSRRGGGWSLRCRRLAAALFVFFVFLVVAPFCHAQSTPQLINYQGRLADSNGVVLLTGEYELAATLTDGSGSNVWSELHDAVPVVRGHFNLVLGGKSNGLATAMIGGDRSIEVSAAGGYTTGVQRLLSVPYAIQAQQLPRFPVPPTDHDGYALSEPTGADMKHEDLDTYPPLEIEITARGRPVFVGLTSTNSGVIKVQDGSLGGYTIQERVEIEIVRTPGDIIVCSYELDRVKEGTLTTRSLAVPASCVSAVDFPGPGTHSYRVRCNLKTADSYGLLNVMLYALEL